MRTTTLAMMTEAMNQPRQPRYHQRITWVDGVAHVQRVEVGKTYAEAGEIVRRATPEDMTAMSNGYMQYDSETDPSAKAWRKHVDEGGD